MKYSRPYVDTVTGESHNGWDFLSIRHLLLDGMFGALGPVRGQGRSRRTHKALSFDMISTYIGICAAYYYSLQSLALGKALSGEGRLIMMLRFLAAAAHIYTLMCRFGSLP